MSTFFRLDWWIQNALGLAQAGSQVYVCTQPTNVLVIPPTPLASLYADPLGATPIVQPITADGLGHIDCYVQAGVYTIVVVKNGAILNTYPDQTVATADAVVLSPTADQIITSNNLLPSPGNTTQSLGSSAAPWNATLNTVAVKSLNTTLYADQFSGSDAGAKIQAAHDALGATGGTINASGLSGAISAAATITFTKPVRLLLGQCTFTLAGSPGINLNYEGCSIEGIAPVTTILQTSHATADIIQFNQVFQRASNFSMAANVARTGGAALSVISSHADCRNIRIDTTYNGISLVHNGSQGYFNNISMGAGESVGGNWNIGIIIGGVSSGTVTSSSFEGCQINGDAQFGAALCALYDGCDAISFTNCQFVQGGFDATALLLDQINGGSYPEWMKFTNCYFEAGRFTGTGSNIVVVNKGRHVDFENCYAEGGQVGLTVAGGIDIKWIGGIIAENEQHGVLISGGTGVVIAHTGIGDNSLETNGGYDDIHVSAGVTDFSLLYNFFADILAQSPANSANYHINIASGSSNNYQVIGNDLSGPYATAPLNNLATGYSGHVLYNNPKTGQIVATGLSANYNSGSAKILVTPTTNNQYRISFNQEITTAASSTSTFPSLTLGWTDSAGIARTKQLVATSATNTTAVESDGVAVIWTNTSTAVTITSASYASSGGTAMVYDLVVTIEQL